MKIILKHSTVAGKVPKPSDLEEGELALNTKDGKIFMLDAGAVVEASGKTPTIDPTTKNWFIDGVDTGIKAEGADGVKGADGVAGSTGPKGDPGKDGTGVSIKGQKDDEAAIKLVTGSKAGDMWIAKDTGHGWVSDGATPTVWTDAGAIKGPKGDDGAKGDKGDDGAKGADGTGTGIAPADQAKLDHITIASDLDIDTINTNAKSAIKKVGDLNLDGSGATLMTAKDIELAQKQVVPTDPALALKDNRMITVASTIEAFNNMSIKVMMEKGIITDISGITETGIYEGTDVANSPMTGPIMVMANKDTNGDFGFFLMGADGALHTGGKAQLGSTFWTEVQSKAVAEGEITVDASYSGVFVSPDMDSFTGSATSDLYDGKPHKVMFVNKTGNDWTSRKDPYIWYLKTGGELGHFNGASGNIGSASMKGWVAHKNIITVQYTDSTKKLFKVLKVEGDTQVGGSDHLLADGTVEMDTKYTPKNDQSIATKKFVEDGLTHLQSGAGHSSSSIVHNGVSTPSDTLGKDGDMFLEHTIAANGHFSFTSMLNSNGQFDGCVDTASNTMLELGYNASKPINNNHPEHGKISFRKKQYYQGDTVPSKSILGKLTKLTISNGSVSVSVDVPLSTETSYAYVLTDNADLVKLINSVTKKSHEPFTFNIAYEYLSGENTVWHKINGKWVEEAYVMKKDSYSAGTRTTLSTVFDMKRDINQEHITAGIDNNFNFAIEHLWQDPKGTLVAGQLSDKYTFYTRGTLQSIHTTVDAKLKKVNVIDSILPFGTIKKKFAPKITKIVPDANEISDVMDTGCLVVEKELDLSGDDTFTIDHSLVIQHPDDTTHTFLSFFNLKNYSTVTDLANNRAGGYRGRVQSVKTAWDKFVSSVYAIEAGGVSFTYAIDGYLKYLKVDTDADALKLHEWAIKVAKKRCRGR